MSIITKTPTPLAQAVTVHRAFSMGGAPLFAVQADVPLADALNTLSLLIGAASSGVSDVAIAMGEGNAPDAPWGTAHLLEAAYALTSSIHSGLIEAQRTAPSSVQVPSL